MRKALIISVVVNVVLLILSFSLYFSGANPPESSFVGNPIEVDVEWAAVQGVFHAVPQQIYSVSQTHSRSVRVVLDCGVALLSVEPALDDVLDLAEQSGNTEIIRITE